MTSIHILRAFTDEKGKFGSFAGIVIDEGRHLSDSGRQVIARRLGYEETLFVNDAETANVSIFDLQKEIKFAGVPVVCGAWLLRKINVRPVEVINCLGGGVQTWQSEGLTWVRTSLNVMPPWNHRQFESAEAIDRITAEEGTTMDHTMAWAWRNESQGLIRARTFMSDWEIAEAESNGSGSMMLAAMLKRSIQIEHGLGSVIFARPSEDNCAEVGGRVVQDEDIVI